MKKVNWLLERNIFDADEQFLEKFKNQGHFWKETSYLKFHSSDANQYFPEHECVLFRVSLNLGRNI